ncbi:hypothetical protein QX201_005675 [Fusarium graminearum]
MGLGTHSNHKLCFHSSLLLHLTHHHHLHNNLCNTTSPSPGALATQASNTTAWTPVGHDPITADKGTDTQSQDHNEKAGDEHYTGNKQYRQDLQSKIEDLMSKRNKLKSEMKKHELKINELKSKFEKVESTTQQAKAQKVKLKEKVFEWGNNVPKSVIKEICLVTDEFDSEMNQLFSEIKELYLEINGETKSLHIRADEAIKLDAQISLSIKEMSDDISMLDADLQRRKQIIEANNGAVGEQEQLELDRLSQTLANKRANANFLINFFNDEHAKCTAKSYGRRYQPS